ncbi:hypothetical protein KEM60_02357 [Austwickia sp. TVS 96-490-7B]|uniref:bifunctional acetate--CoA ligase family protein/GNAT family N-acetyltransferase n=1 Tax=Austwickia sp. TVS 96-490-7B TaxID=2830843 RepID=UPI001C57F129|nr:GNAT family N-acetyltransferase [Austwickia sp. TVS 96-490-7B]MBW3086146.1 hypothetical protein [Austwickia sp. TVS 96-490-7B]
MTDVERLLGDPPEPPTGPGADPPKPDAHDAPPLPANYPHRWEADVVLRDGSLAQVRPIVPGDADGLRAFHAGQSEESIYLRFFAPLKELSDKDVVRFTHVDYVDRVALVVTMRDAIIGVGRYDRLADATTAEVAFNISDHHQGKGIGSVLLEHLAAIAQERGIDTFVADVLPQNRKMMKVFTDAGYDVGHHFDDGIIAVRLSLQTTARSAEVSLSREHRAEAENMADVLAPRSVAVVGVSRRPDALGSIVLDNILDGGFTGQIYPVNCETDQFRGLPSYERVSDIAGAVDLAVIAVPAEAVLDVIADCAAKNVTAVTVISSGFAESDDDGVRRQDELLRRARAAGMRVLGPLSFGLVNNHPDVQLNATISRRPPPRGGLGVMSQSGGLGVGLLTAITRRGLGVSTFVSSGNRIDISGNDLMQYWIDDDHTRVVGMYLESVGNPRKYSRIARQLALRKPVIVVKSDALAVPPGHRARAPRISPAAFDALLQQAGVIRAHTIHQLVDIAELVAHQPLPTGNQIVIVSNSDGLSQVIADAALSRGLVLARNPVRVPANATARDVQTAMDAAFAAAPDAVVVCLIPPLQSSDETVATTVAHACWGHNIPCVATFLGMRDVSESLYRAGEPQPDMGPNLRRVIPLYQTAVDGVEALARVAKYALWREADHGEHVRPRGLNRAGAQHLVDAVLQVDPAGRALTSGEAHTLLAAYGIHLWPATRAANPEEAVAAAAQIGYPVVVRALADDLRSHPGSGAVHADLHSDHAVRDAYIAMSTRLADHPDPQLAVQRMAPPGVATTLCSHEDPLFGPVVSFGIAGPATDLLGDLSYRIPPLTDVDARDLIDSLRAAPLLTGQRGRPPVDRAVVEDLILRVAALADDLPEIAALELDPIITHETGAEVLGAHIDVAPAPARRDAGRRALT